MGPPTPGQSASRSHGKSNGHGANSSALRVAHASCPARSAGASVPYTVCRRARRRSSGSLYTDLRPGASGGGAAAACWWITEVGEAVAVTVAAGTGRGTMEGE